jgi:heterogeneous nuclear ribonucleoprotein K
MGSGKTDFRFLIPSRDAGAIIGKGGKIIQDLRLKHRCQIQMADCDVPERVLIINGDQTDVLNCMLDILSCISENHQRSNKPDQSEVRALIHQSQAGALIGKGASRVKEFREKYNIDVKVYPQCCPGGSTERCISMRGNKDDVLRCLTEVYSVLDGVPPRGPYRYYDPSTYNGYNVADYGGYSDNSMGNNHQNLRANNATGYVNNPYVQPPPPPPQGYPQYGGTYPDDNYGGNRNRASGYNPSYQQSGPVTTTQVTIPTEMAGIIIGTKGSKISQIRQESGASIKIDSEPMKGTNDRLITITGNPNQIQQAQFLLQQTIRQSGLWNQ